MLYLQQCFTKFQLSIKYYQKFALLHYLTLTRHSIFQTPCLFTYITNVASYFFPDSGNVLPAKSASLIPWRVIHPISQFQPLQSFSYLVYTHSLKIEASDGLIPQSPLLLLLISMFFSSLHISFIDCFPKSRASTSSLSLVFPPLMLSLVNHLTNVLFPPQNFALLPPHFSVCWQYLLQAAGLQNPFLTCP